MARSPDFLRSTPRIRSRVTPDDNDDHEDFDAHEPHAAEGRSFEEEREWRGAGVLSLGVIAGALVGAGVALLLAPQSGAETRERIADRARRLRTHADEGWDDLRDELRRLRRRSRRAATRGRWKVEDLLS
jgi:YtxH-like protein